MAMTIQEADAIIDSALLTKQTGASSSTTTTESGLQPGPLPTDETPKAPPPPKETKEQEKIRKAQEDLLGEKEAKRIADEQEAERKRLATIQGAAERAGNALKGAASTASVKIAGIPTPGNLVVPLFLLIFFFFILITYGGNTRLQWLWLVLTNNAYITPTDQTSSTATTGHSGPDTQSVLASQVTMTSHQGSGMYGSPFS